MKNGGQRLVEFIESEGGAVEVLAELLVQASIPIIEGDLPFDEFLRKPVELKACIQYEFIRLDFVASVEPWLLSISVTHN